LDPSTPKEFVFDGVPVELELLDQLAPSRESGCDARTDALAQQVLHEASALDASRQRLRKFLDGRARVIEVRAGTDGVVFEEPRGREFGHMSMAIFFIKPVSSSALRRRSTTWRLIAL
jgi:hypothetical protein